MKYYFGYYLWHGKTLPLKWVESNGIPTGGKFEWLERQELTETEFETMTIEVCEATWSYKGSV